MKRFKLNRIQDTDIFTLANENEIVIGDTLAEGTFTEVFAFAQTLSEQPDIDLGTGDSVTIENAIGLTDVLDAKWFVLFKDENVDTLRIDIIRTSGNEMYSLPTNVTQAYQEPLVAIFTRVHAFMLTIL
jgi:hypothetical protein